MTLAAPHLRCVPMIGGRWLSLAGTARDLRDGPTPEHGTVKGDHPRQRTDVTRRGQCLLQTDSQEEPVIRYALELLCSYLTTPATSSLDTATLAACIGACFDCQQACIACADACLGERQVSTLIRCIPYNARHLPVILN